MIDHPDHLSGQNNQLENHSSMPILVGLKLAIRQKQTWVMAILGAAMSSTLLAFGALWGVPYMMLVYKVDRHNAAGSVSLLLLG